MPDLRTLRRMHGYATYWRRHTSYAVIAVVLLLIAYSSVRV